MSVLLQEHGGMFMAKCMLNEWPGHELLALVDSGANATFVAASICKRARLKYRGTKDNLGCIHGEGHRGVEVGIYQGTIATGGKTGAGTVYALNDGVEIGGISIDAVLGHDVLKYFDVRLNWKGGFGSMEQ